MVIECWRVLTTAFADAVSDAVDADEFLSETFGEFTQACFLLWADS
jgi:hypothetical protein